MGTLSVLNVASGDIRLSFDQANVSEAIRAKRIIQDMLKRGYALLVEVDGAYQRAMAFDPEKGEYVISDFDPSPMVTRVEEPEYEPETREESETSAAPNDRPAIQETPKRRGRASTRLPMERANAVGIARSAGG